MTTTLIDTQLAPAPAVRAWGRLVTDTRYVLTGFPLAVVAFSVCLTGFAAGAGLAVVWVGVPLLAAALMWARGFAAAERARVAPVLGAALPAPSYRTAASASLPARLIAVLADPQAWRDLTHAVLRLAPSTIAFSFVATWWAGVLGGATWSLWGWALPGDDVELPELLGFGDGYGTIVLFYLAVAAVFALTLPAVARAAARFEAGFARALL
ncbi:sensor domain-containing protein [Actinoplanes sp. NPDC051513]|uniref:sensor domain-containing protein n=1 Tax=Actinoplanes sp. NPDC051513 TaxID=3363908 RepID=UPI00379ECFB5